MFDNFFLCYLYFVTKKHQRKEGTIMRKLFKATLTTATAFLLVLAGTSTVTLPLPEDETGIVTDTDLTLDGEPEETPEVQPTSDHPSRDEKKEPLS